MKHHPTFFTIYLCEEFSALLSFALYLPMADSRAVLSLPYRSATVKNDMN